MNGIFKSFDLFNHEFSSGNKLVNLFSGCFSFFLSDRKSIESRKSYFHKLNEVVFNISTDSKSAVIILDTSIKNSIATLILHVHTHNSPVIKTIHYATNVISTKAELFAIRCGLNQAIWLLNIKWIIVVKIIDDRLHFSFALYCSFPFFFSFLFYF